MTAGVVAALRTRVPAALTLRGALERPPRRAALVSEQARHRAGGPGTGFDLALLSAQLRHCDKTGTPAYLEATQHTLIGFYETFGFTRTDPLDVPHGGPRVWGMWRAPR